MNRIKTFLRDLIAFALIPIKQYAEKYLVCYADTAFQIQYRQEYIKQFEQHESLLRETTTTEAVIKGQQAVFLVAGSGNSNAVTRGTNGMIPARPDSLTQNTATLQEWHDLVRKTGFNIFASQGNQRAVMQMSSVGVLNRKIDSTIISELNTGTVAIGTAAQTIPNVAFMVNGLVKLQNASVPWDGNITALIQPSFLAYLMQTTEFASAKYVDVKPFAGENVPAFKDRPRAYEWMGFTLISHPNLPGKGTTAEVSFMYHKSAIGHAMDTAGLQTPVGYFEEQDYSWARATAYMGAKLLQNTGVVVMTADGSAYA